MVNDNRGGLSYFQNNTERLDLNSIHEWYRFPFAYSDRIITDIAEDFKIGDDDIVLDPFNGTGTTTLTCKYLGIDSIGVDASPVSLLSSRVKTNWDLEIDRLVNSKNDLLDSFEPICQEISEGNDTSLEFEEPNALLDGWISDKPMKKMLALKNLIRGGAFEIQTENIFKLAMISILAREASNISFGPTPYKTAPKEDANVFSLFSNKLDDIVSDLYWIKNEVESGKIAPGKNEYFKGDSRNIDKLLWKNSNLIDGVGNNGNVDFVITSPPYPNERDYTRIQRLELIWLDEVKDNSDLQELKKRHIRSNTKNIYVDDNDGETTDIRSVSEVDSIINKMESIIDEEDISHGFGLYYPRVIEEYFGGMYRHLKGIFNVLSSGGKIAYVVGNQHTYWKIKIPTGDILRTIGESRVGFKFIDKREWRKRWSSNHKKNLSEEILIMEKPNN